MHSPNGEVYGEFRLGNFGVFLTCVGDEFTLQYKQGAFVHEQRVYSGMDHFKVQAQAEANFARCVKLAIEKHQEIRSTQ